MSLDDVLHDLDLRGLGMLAILRGMLIISTVVAGSVGSASHGALGVASRLAVAFAFNFALFMVAFRRLPAFELTWR
jgi:hypothetical protein